MQANHDRAGARQDAPRATRVERGVAVIGLVVLLVLHFDAWREPDPAARVGWLPLELAWRLAWMVAAGAYLWWFTARFWRAKRSEQAGR